MLSRIAGALGGLMFAVTPCQLLAAMDASPDNVLVIVVDDLGLEHLRVAGLGVRCALAAWGYNGEREVELARQRGYRVCTLENVEEQLFRS